jgi:competence protein ComEC
VARQVVWRHVLAGHVLDVGSARVALLHPAAPEWERQRVRNDDSLVLRVTFGAVEFLLTGDAGPEFERAFEPATPAARLRVVKMGHHGSLSASSARFVALERPDVAIVSAGRGNVFGHPAPEVLARYSRAGAAIFRTDQDGAVMLDTDGRSLSVMTVTGRRWQFVTQ